MQRVGGVAALGLSALLVALAALADQAWVHGEMRLNLRSGPGEQYRIMEVLKTGDSLEVLKRDDKWTMVRTPAGDEGWIPGGYLDPQPPPTVRLEELEAEVANLRDALERTEAEASSLRQSSEELASNDSEQKTEIERLTKENYRLHAGERWAEWITGALVLSTGMVLGALMSRISSRRHRQRRGEHQRQHPPAHPAHPRSSVRPGVRCGGRHTAGVGARIREPAATLLRGQKLQPGRAGAVPSSSICCQAPSVSRSSIGQENS